FAPRMSSESRPRAVVMTKDLTRPKGPMACVFCELLARRIPAAILYEDELAAVFLPRHPLVPGHCLIVPRAHSADLFDISDEDAAAIMCVARRVARALRESLGCAGVNLLHASGVAAGQSVAHMHVHIVPRWPEDGIDAWPRGPSARPELSNEALEALR